MSRRVLISGASIAGNAVAWWLGHYGFDVVVVEKAEGFRDGGQNIDVRGPGREVLRRMGLERTALEMGTGETGTTWVDADGKVIAQVITAELGSDGPTAEMEILRGDLARLIFEPASKSADFRFGESIAAIEHDGAEASVTFASGRIERFDIVIVAEGVGSSTREQQFPGENNPRYMDMTIAYFTIPKAPDDNGSWRLYNTVGSRTISLRPDMHGTTRASLSILKRPDDEQKWDVDRQKSWLHRQFGDAGYESRRILDGMDQTKDFYFDVLRQVRMPRWSRANIALTGDAAWCVTPMGGLGATLAVVGGYVLAGELASRPDVPSAFEAYERVMRPYVERTQNIPKGVARLANPRSRLGITLFHGILRVVTVPFVSKLLVKVFTRKSEKFQLPDYATPAPNAARRVG